MAFETIIISSWADFDWTELWCSFPMLTVYRHPSDMPDKYVVRLWDLDRPLPFVVVADSEEQAIYGIPRSFVRLERSQADEPHIVCVYV
jgi:hypothetical protein